MKKLISILIIIIVSVGCSDDPQSHIMDDFDGIFVGELIDGPANIRDTIKGELLFELNDGVLVEATKFQNDWCMVGTNIQVSKKEFENDKFELGSPILDMDGEVIGTIKGPITNWRLDEDEENYYGYIAGYTHRGNIRKETLVEYDLEKFIKEKGRSQDIFELFITAHQFGVDDRFMNFEGFYIYENWITDPSPGFRICLLFKEGKLQGILHSRSLSIPNTTKHNLSRDNYVSFFNDYPKSKQQEFVEYMNEWLSGVD